MGLVMQRLFLVAAALVSAAPAIAAELPARKAGLWEIKMTFDGRNLPAQVMKQCTDADSDKLMNTNFGGGTPGMTCAKQDFQQVGPVMTMDSVCTFGGATTTSHAVITGSFDSAYTIQVASKREGGPPLPGVKPGAETHMTIAGKWLGPCDKGQRPGDVVMANGMTMNVLDMHKAMPPPR